MPHNLQSPLYSLQNVPIDSGSLILTKCLGHGAYGVVYEATSLQKRPRSSFSIPTSRTSAMLAIRHLQKMPAAPKARYAVKAVLNSLHEPARVQRETEAHLHLRASGHRGILTLHRVIREKHFMYLVLDLCSSGDLYDAVSRGMYFRRLQDIKSIFLQLIDAVEHCHSLGIFHRDIKLENILLKNEEGEPPHIVLSDFGLATEEIRARDPIGSLMYMSPECLRCKFAIPDYDCAPNDVWSMGIILVILILGNSAPWEVASDACPIFWCYVKNAQDFFTTQYSMTPETNALMTKIFELIPSDRISLRDLRPAVDALNEFISTPVDEEYGGTVPKNASEELIFPQYSVGSRSTSPPFLPLSLGFSVSEYFDPVSGLDTRSIRARPQFPEAREEIPSIYEEMDHDHAEEGPEPYQPGCNPHDADAIESGEGLGLSLGGPKEALETVVAAANQLDLETSPPEYQEVAQESSPPMSRDMIMPRSLRATLSHRAVAHFLLYGRANKNKNSRQGWSPRFAGHGPSPLRQMVSLDDSCSSSSASCSSGHSSPTGTTSSLSDCDHEIDSPVTPPMGLIDDGVIKVCDMDDDSHFSTPAAELAIVGQCTTTKPLELKRMAIRLGLSLIAGPTKQPQIHKRVPVPSVSQEAFTSPPCPALLSTSGSHPLERFKTRDFSSPREGREDDSFRLIKDTSVGGVGVEVEVRKSRWERLAARPRIRVGAVAVGGSRKARC